MDPDDNVCLCYRVSLRKLRTFINRERPTVASQLGDCLGAGTGCGWCCPFLESLHEQAIEGEIPDLPLSPTEYAEKRIAFRKTGRRSD